MWTSGEVWKIMLGISLELCVLLQLGSSGVDPDRVSVSVNEGDPVTLHTTQINQKDRIKWYINNIRIAQITGDQSKICTEDQCKERFRDRLKLDHQTGSLTIMNTRTTDSGEYMLEIFSSKTDSLKIFNVTVNGPVVSVNEGDSVTLHTDITTNQQDRIKWYFKDTRIAQINGDLSQICTDVQCNNGTERFRDRLKLDHQTGSLTIMNITNTDSGVYHLQITSRNSENVFNVAVHGVSAADEMKIKSVKEGESVTFDPGVIKHPNHVMTWYFNDVLIAEITGDQSKICTDEQCEDAYKRFRGRLEVDHQTGSLTIMNSRNTDSGEYKLQINSKSSRFSIRRIFSVAVTDSGLSPGAIGGIIVGVVLVAAAAAAVTAGVIYCHKPEESSRSQSPNENHNQKGVGYSAASNKVDLPNGTSHHFPETPNGTSHI